MIDIQNIESQLERYKALHGNPPDNLSDAGINPTPSDPWGNPYEYLKLAGEDPLPPGTRKDKSTKPLSDDFDLYSKGKDGQSVPALTGGPSHDDIIRANNGGYIGLASEY
jgi:general secretion pathway protein G